MIESGGQLLVVFCVDDKYGVVFLGEKSGAILSKHDLFNSLDDLMNTWAYPYDRLVTELDYKATDCKPKEN